MQFIIMNINYEIDYYSFKQVSSLMVSFNIHEITILIMNEDHKQLLIRICTGLSG